MARLLVCDEAVQKVSIALWTQLRPDSNCVASGGSCVLSCTGKEHTRESRSAPGVSTGSSTHAHFRHTASWNSIQWSLQARLESSLRRGLKSRNLSSSGDTPPSAMTLLDWIPVKRPSSISPASTELTVRTQPRYGALVTSVSTTVEYSVYQEMLHPMPRPTWNQQQQLDPQAAPLRPTSQCQCRGLKNLEIRLEGGPGRIQC